MNQTIRKINDMTYSLNDIGLIPARISQIEHRSDCNVYNFDNMLPLFTAPMNSVINEYNYEVFLANCINTIIPRGIDYDKRFELSNKTFVAFGLAEFEQFIKDFSLIFNTTEDVRYVCIDIANGHMRKLIDLCAQAKDQFGGRLLLMTGNIANPDTYTDYALAGIDFIRVGIGGGSVCTTSANGGVHYGMASLIKRTYEIKQFVQQSIKEAEQLRISCPYKSVPFIIADGGFDNYDKIIKALALGADYVMIGKIFAQCDEACGEVKTLQAVCVDGITDKYPEIPKNAKWEFDEEELVYRTKYRSYYGMSTKRAQVENNNSKLKTAEGIEITVPILYNLSKWCENFIDYLRSMMSYTNSLTLEEFKNTNYVIISPAEYLTYYK